ncbi:hypothetical protein PGB90_006320 [Kerria lacca]
MFLSLRTIILFFSKIKFSFSSFSLSLILPSLKSLPFVYSTEEFLTESTNSDGKLGSSLNDIKRLFITSLNVSCLIRLWGITACE